MSSNTRDKRSRSRSRSLQRSRSCSVELLGGAKEISEKDYFLKNDEFRMWLKEGKDKVYVFAEYCGECPDTFQYFSDLSSNKARRLTCRCSSFNHLMTPYIVYSY